MAVHLPKKEKNPPENKLSFFRRPPHIFCLIISAVSNTAEEGEQIDAADTHNHIYDSGNPAHASEKESDQVQIEKTNQSPVNSSDNGDSQRRIS